jgi:putative transposase
VKRKHQGYGDTLPLDEVFVKIQGKQHYLWRSVDQDGEVVDVFLQERSDFRVFMRQFTIHLIWGDTWFQRIIIGS